uniref:ARAD1A12738p n=1 Tax=Blastobotrys adeninivorans TaxID=409370 RepID=A0A060SXZ0_BLAAD
MLHAPVSPLDLFPSIQGLLFTYLGYLLIIYLCSFLVLAIIRILTGVSIKRLGYFSLRHVSFSPKPGIHVSIGAIGLSFHRPSVARPGWLHVYCSNTDVSLDSKIVLHPGFEMFSKESDSSKHKKSFDNCTEIDGDWAIAPPKTTLFYLTRFILRYNKYLEIIATSTAVTYTDIASIVVGSLSFKVDLRDIRNRQHNTTFVGTLDTHKFKQGEISAYCRLMCQDFYISKRFDDPTPREFLDYLGVDITGVLGTNDLSIKDISLALKLGHALMLVDKAEHVMKAVKNVRQQIADEEHINLDEEPTSTGPASPTLSAQSSPPALLTETDKRNLSKIGTILVRVVKEVEFRVGYFGVSGWDVTSPDGAQTMSFQGGAKDLVLDLRRLNPQSPGFKLFFNDNDTAHQAIFSMSSLSLGAGAGDGEAQREMLYVPMSSVISKTNVFSKTIQFVEAENASANQSIFRAYANIVSPTVDVEARHVPILRDVLRSNEEDQSKKRASKFSLNRFRQLLPRANVKFSITEPAARLLVGDSHNESRSMVISSSSKIQCDFESSHSTDSANPDYHADATLQISSFDTWYRSASGDRHEVFTSENLFFKIGSVMTRSTLDSSISAVVSNAHFLLTKKEVVKGISEIFQHRVSSRAKKMMNSPPPTKKLPFLLNIPPWVSDVSIEIADTAVSIATQNYTKNADYLRGLTLKMGNSGIKYNRSDHKGGRWAMVTMNGIEGYKIEEPYELDIRPECRFFLLENVEVRLKSYIDEYEIPHFNCKVALKDVLLHYDLNLHFLFMLSVMMIRRAFALGIPRPASPETADSTPSKTINLLHLTTDIIKLKVELPQKEHIMIETNDLVLHKTSDRSKKSTSYAKAIRLYARHPFVSDAWCRLVSLKHPQADITTISKTGPIEVCFDAMRLNIPNQFVTYRVLDNSVTLFKSVARLTEEYHKRGKFVRDSPDRKPKEKSKMPNIPKVRIKSPVLLLSLEDDHFESQLGLIFQVGAREQKIRLEKERAFEAKVVAINAAKERSKFQQAAPSNPSTLRGKKSGLFAKGNGPFSKSHTVIGTEEPVFDGSNRGKKSTEGPSRSTTFDTANSADSASTVGTTGGDDAESIAATDRSINLGVKDHEAALAKHKKHSFMNLQNVLHKRRDRMKYTMKSPTAPSEESAVTIETARQKLKEHFSKSWIQAFKDARRYQKEAVKKNIDMIWGPDSIDHRTARTEEIVDYSEDPMLFHAIFRNLDLQIQSPDFDERGLRTYLHNIGKKLPMDTRFGLLVPLRLDMDVSEVRMGFRDYPLPALHFPDLHPSQDPSICSIKIGGNFVVAEELWLDEASIRRLDVPLVPSAVTYPCQEDVFNHYVVDVVRTVSAVKMYTDLNFQINSINSTRFSWAQSTQPAMQTVMQAFDSFSKPPIDPSPKLGFWDKMRAIFHARLRFEFKEGDVQLLLKGSRSPYELQSFGAGFVMCWSKNVVLTVNEHDDPRRLMGVTSDEYLLAIPNYVVQEKDYFRKRHVFAHAIMSKTSYSEHRNFHKVMMKLTGKVRWQLGLMFEQDQADSIERTSEFIPHYTIALAKPQLIDDLDNYDAYKGFRSKYMHMAISVSSPHREVTDYEPVLENTYNTIHLTPLAITHFQKWWKLFDGALSLPPRNGKLFQPNAPKKPKFGRHLYTVKYQLVLSPLFIAHTYRHPHTDDITKPSKLASTGIKSKIDRFIMDLHQRREPEPGTKRWRMKLHRGEIDLKETDMRVVVSRFKEKSPQELVAKKLGVQESPASSVSNENSSAFSSNVRMSGKFKIHDNDYAWIDMNDYTELESPTPITHMPRIDVLPLLYTPRWTYFRQTDHTNTRYDKTEDGTTYVKFGSEHVHQCLIGRTHPESTQVELFLDRAEEVEEQIKNHEATLDSLNRDLEDFPDEVQIADRIAKLQQEMKELVHRKEWIQERVESIKGPGCQGLTVPEMRRRKDSISSISTNPEGEEHDKQYSSFSNRFIFHSVQLKWNNANRNAIYRFFHRVGDYKAYTYFVTGKALRYLEDVMEKQNERGTTSDTSSSFSTQGTGKSAPSTFENREDLSSQLHSALLSDCCENVLNGSCRRRVNDFKSSLRETREKSHNAVDSYLVRFLSPQIQLVSDQNPDQCVLLVSEGIDLGIIDIMDENNDEDDVSGVVETRYGLELKDAQFFVFSTQEIQRGNVTFFGSNGYGSGDLANWPPWLGLECCYHTSPYLKDHLVVQRTSATLRYDKPNSLRVQKLLSRDETASTNSSEEAFGAHVVQGEKYRANRITVDFPKVVAACDSAQYFAVYTIALDLLVYSEPTRQQYTERLEEIMLATDFSDLNKAVDRIQQLRTDIRQLEEVRQDFNLRSGDLGDRGESDRTLVETEFLHSVMELMVMMRAIRTGMQKGRNRTSDTSQFLKWAISADQIVWHVLSKDRKPFLDVGLAEASFNRLEGDDGFNTNTIEVGMLQSFNLSPNALYQELISPYLVEGERNGEGDRKAKLIFVEWTMLDPIGGIPIMDHFEVKLEPLKIQLDHESGQKVFEYIFPSRDEESPFQLSAVSPGEAAALSQNGNSTDSSDDGSDDDDDDDESIATGRGKQSVRSSNTKSGGMFSRLSQLKNGTGSGNSSQLGSARGHRKLLSASNDAGSIGGSSGSIRGGSIRSGRGPASDATSITSRGRSEHRSFSFQGTRSSSRSADTKSSEAKNDDFAIMLKRASNYTSIVDIKIDSTVLCVSYKGPGNRSFMDIHEFVLRLPDFEYKNKTWSNYDLAMRLKKDVIRTLLQHTGALIGNKLTRHRRKKNQPLKQLTSYMSFTSVQDLTENSSPSSSRAPSVPGSPRITITGADSDDSGRPSRTSNGTGSGSGQDAPSSNDNSVSATQLPLHRQHTTSDIVRPTKTTRSSTSGSQQPLSKFHSTSEVLSASQQSGEPNSLRKASSFVKGIVSKDHESSVSPGSSPQLTAVGSSPLRPSISTASTKSHASSPRPPHSTPDSPLTKLRRLTKSSTDDHSSAHNSHLHVPEQDQASSSESEGDNIARKGKKLLKKIL